MVDRLNGNGTSIVNSRIEEPRVGRNRRASSQVTTSKFPLPLHLEKRQSNEAVARLNSRIHRRLGRNTMAILRTFFGALAMAGCCIYWFTHSPSLPVLQYQTGIPVTVEILHDHSPVLPGPFDNTTTKYFHEPANHEPGDDPLLGHYDIRYFSGQKVSYEERTDTLHHLIRAYLISTRALNLETWIVHGTLLGWWWNGQILPWDWDLDVQVTAATLQDMGKRFNGTFHSYKSGDVEREYLLDVNVHIDERENGDNMNIIDARWIDTRNGLFVDITGLAEIYPKRPKIWSCKNYHDYHEDDIWPLRQTSFEGVPAMVPANYEKVLIDEYSENSLKATKFEGHHWDAELEKWIADKTSPTSPQAQAPITNESQEKTDESQDKLDDRPTINKETPKDDRVMKYDDFKKTG